MEKAIDFARLSQEELQKDLREVFLGAIRMTLEVLLENEVREMVGAGRYQRLISRKDSRNGTYLRRLITSMGQVETQIPRTRSQGSPNQVMGEYRRRTEDVDNLITEAYVNGVSTRGIEKLTQALMGKSVKRSTVSRVTKQLEELVKELRETRIEAPVPYLYLDGTFLDARWARSVENVAALVAYGIGMDGHRRLLGIVIGPEESEASWSELLSQLVDRGLDGVRLVISDDHKGLQAAVRRHFPEAERQRCIVHLERNVLQKAPRRHRKRLARAVSDIFKAPNLRDAHKRLAALQEGLGSQVPEAMECLENGFAAATRYYAFPQAHWKRIRSTNGNERLHAEIKRRIKSVGAFPDRASALRLVTAVAIESTRKWGQRRYLDMGFVNPPATTVVAGRPAQPPSPESDPIKRSQATAVQPMSKDVHRPAAASV